MLCLHWTNGNQWTSLHPTTFQHSSPFPNCPVQWHRQHSSLSSWFFIFTLPLHFPIPAHTEDDELQQGRRLWWYFLPVKQQKASETWEKSISPDTATLTVWAQMTVMGLYWGVRSFPKLWSCWGLVTSFRFHVSFRAAYDASFSQRSSMVRVIYAS